VTNAPALIPGGPPTPDLVTNQIFEGGFSLNYANEPLPWRVDPSPSPSVAAGPEATDLADAFRSITRNDPALNCQPAAGAPINPQPNCAASMGGTGFKYAPPQPGVDPTDPYTPLLGAYEGDNVQIRNLVGAHMAPHSFHIHGLNWQFEPAVDSSGFRSTQGMGISEHYEFLFHIPTTNAALLKGADVAKADYLYIPTSDVIGVQYGNWGLLRSYRVANQKTHALPDLVSLQKTQQIAFPGSKPMPPPEPSFACPANAPKREPAVTAVYAPKALGGALLYNSRPSNGELQQDANALLYVMTSDLNNGVLKPEVHHEPLILRAAAGECIHLTLTNGLPPAATGLNPGLPAQSAFPEIQLQSSHQVGLHPQLLAYDVRQSDGFNIGQNGVTTAAPGQQVTYTWYAGKIIHSAGGATMYTPVEFGAVDLAPADPLMQDNFGLIGALIIEPRGSTWKEDQNTRAGATVSKAGKTLFREGVAIFQDDVGRWRSTTAPSRSPTASRTRTIS
jgi:hypothetical protein